MTTVQMKLVIDFVDAKNNEDVSAFLECFSPESVVRDTGENEVLEGLEAIRSWGEKIFQTYKLTTAPISLSDEGSGVLFKANVSGDFEGSPIVFSYRFSFENSRILELVIE
jgi:ketosteroid isomerase-like protein